jgi:micrococcal nuclease
LLSEKMTVNIHPRDIHPTVSCADIETERVHARRLCGTLLVVVLLAGCSGVAPLPAPDDDPTTAATETVDGQAWNVTVSRVIDGDTVEVRYRNGSTETVRLLGVDTPETRADRLSPEEFETVADSDAGRAHLLSWGQNATGFANRRLAGQQVRLVVDDTADRRGGYGRLLGYIYVDGDNFNKQLLSKGYARLYESEFTLREEFAASERTARRAAVGLWAFSTDETAS